MAVAPAPAALISLTRSWSVSVELSVIVVTVEPLMAWVELAVDGRWWPAVPAGASWRPVVLLPSVTFSVPAAAGGVVEQDAVAGGIDLGLDADAQGC